MEPGICNAAPAGGLVRDQRGYRREECDSKIREARTAAGLSQSQLARRVRTSPSYIARLEGGKVRPSTSALERFAQATRTRLRIVFEPQAAS